MTPTSARLISPLVGAGAVGVVLELAGVNSPIRAVLVLLFIAVAPTAAIWGLLSGLDGFARIVIACVTTAVVLSLIAMILLATGLWSPTLGLLAVVVISAGALLAQSPAARARIGVHAQSLWHALISSRARIGAPAGRRTSASADATLRALMAFRTASAAEVPSGSAAEPPDTTPGQSVDDGMAADASPAAPGAGERAAASGADRPETGRSHDLAADATTESSIVRDRA